jgi:hypothetical protein
MERRAAGGATHVKIYAKSCKIKNPGDDLRTYFVSKRECGSVPVAGVTVEGNRVEYDVNNGFLTTALVIPPGESRVLTIEYDRPALERDNPLSMKERVAVRVRRYLSEYRDNHVSRSRFLSSVANTLGRGVRKIGSG